MSVEPRPKRLLRPLFYGGVLCWLLSCASTPPTPPSLPPLSESAGPKVQERISALEEELRAKTAENERLRGAVDLLQAESESPKRRFNAAPASPRARRAVVLSPRPLEVEAPILEPWADGQSLADSVQESLQWYYRGLEYQGAGQYDDAIDAFRAFLKAEPEHVYADRAEFQIALSYQKRGEPGLALAALLRLEGRYPYSMKLSHALLLKGQVQEELGQREESVATYKEVVRRFPASPYATAAARRLVKLPLEEQRGGRS